jgi:outer membrane protein TolC
LQQSVTISSERLKLTNDKFTLGKVSKAEVLKAQVDLNTDKSAYMKQLNSLQNAKINLNQLLARSLIVDFEVAENILINKDLKLAELQNKAKLQNTNLLIIKKNNQISSNTINEIKAERLPTLQFKTGYNFNKQSSEAGFLQSSQTNGFHYGAAINFNLFNGFNTDRRITNAMLNLKSTDITLKDSLQKLDLAVQQTFNNYSLALQLLAIEIENIDLAKNSFELVNEQYKVGLITAIELRDVQQKLLLSETQLSALQLDAKIAEIELQKLCAEITKMID